MTNRGAIVVHIYKEKLHPNEVISLKQLHAVLGNYPVYLVCPRGLNVTEYKAIFKDQLTGTIEFDPGFFKNLNGYNRLLLRKEYYEPYLKYEYVLLYHADAFVFKDEFNVWMDKGYDNIGAPLYHFNNTANPPHYITSGNSGFCLRKVQTFYDLSNSYKSIYKAPDVIENFLNYNWKGRIARLPYYFLMLSTLGSRLHPAFNKIKLNEDMIWGKYVPQYISEFKNAPLEQALQFSMEFNCMKLLEINGGKLPFGCHGWFKPMFLPFWKPHIEAFGYEIQ